MSISEQRVRDTLAAVSSSLGRRLDPPPFHPFPARMPLSIAQHIVNTLCPEGGVVADPMSGSGTTLVAARSLDRESCGFDRDPLALLVARTATRSFRSSKTDDLRERVLHTARHLHARIRVGEERSALSREDQDFVKYWFPTTAQKQLFALARSIDEQGSGGYADLARVVFSSLVIAKSAGASFALDISRSRPHKSDKKDVVLPFDAWDRRFRAVVQRLPFLDRHPTTRPTVRAGDARKLSLGDESTDLILTSPPYLNAIDYLRAHKFSLVWLGHSLSDLRELRGTMVGTERGLWSEDGLPPSVESRLRRTIDRPRRRALVRRYLSDVRQILEEYRRILKPGGLAVLVLGPTIISTRRTDAASVVSTIAEAAGLHQVATVARDLSDQRRSLPFAGTDKDNPLSLRMRREVLVAFRK